MLGIGSWIFHALGLSCGVLGGFLLGFRLITAGPFWAPIFPVPRAEALGARLLFGAGDFANYKPYLYLMFFVLLYCPYLLYFILS